MQRGLKSAQCGILGNLDSALYTRCIYVDNEFASKG